ncbi:hypothetical protein [Candidatus Palauibacter sp.]|uniref:hypothetical protein n=1 Tax=Candidatus Palauibacter sp. TaxID=3101350 RepID=UPI003C700713
MKNLEALSVTCNVSLGSSDGSRREEIGWLPPGAIPLMEAIEGDGSPWSYLSASILAPVQATSGGET